VSHKLVCKLLTATVAAAVLLCGSSAAAQEDLPPIELDEDDIVLPVGLPDDEPYEDDGAEPSGEPAEPPAAATENTPALCGDLIDNDGDGHLDCEDQDCSLFTVCVKPAPAQRPEAPPATAAAPAKPEPRPDIEGPRKRRPSRQERSTLRRLRGLRIVAHTTFWPGLAITSTSSMSIGMAGEACGEDDDLLGICYGVWVGIGSALLLTGLITGTTYRVKRKQYRRDYAVLLTPVLADGFGGIAGVGWF